VTAAAGLQLRTSYVRRMDHIIDGVLRFQREVHPNRETLFRDLALGQSPTAMFIGCADSRIVPEVLTQQGPGSLFVVRNAGNIVPPSSTEPGGVTASIEYAVAVLGVPDIIICGHSGCGAMTAILRSGQQLERLPAVAGWLHYADAARDAVAAEHAGSSEEEKLSALVRENVLAQLDHLLTHSVVAQGVQAKQLRLHGWVYDIASGSVDTYDLRAGRFVPISDDLFASATPIERA
jgi:carbonic anhydrase